MLTAREQEVLRLRQEGLTQTEVAARLEITQAAISSFENNAKRKIEDARQTLRTAERIGITLPNGESGGGR